MLEILGLAIAGLAAVGGHVQSRRFVRERLRFVDAVYSHRAPLIAGAAAAVAASPVVWVLPLVGAGTAVLFGVGVGTGVSAGRRAARRLPAGE
jgi:hypothetical protein